MPSADGLAILLSPLRDRLTESTCMQHQCSERDSYLIEKEDDEIALRRVSWYEIIHLCSLSLSMLSDTWDGRLSDVIEMISWSSSIPLRDCPRRSPHWEHMYAASRRWHGIVYVCSLSIDAIRSMRWKASSASLMRAPRRIVSPLMQPHWWAHVRSIEEMTWEGRWCHCNWGGYHDMRSYIYVVSLHWCHCMHEMEASLMSLRDCLIEIEESLPNSIERAP
jgi:hypothetical protein